jgi:hypothetical protein
VCTHPTCKKKCSAKRKIIKHPLSVKVRKNDPAIKYIENDDLLVACNGLLLIIFRISLWLYIKLASAEYTSFIRKICR